MIAPPFYKPKVLNWLQNNYISTNNEIWTVTYQKTGTTLTIQICIKLWEFNIKKQKIKYKIL